MINRANDLYNNILATNANCKPSPEKIKHTHQLFDFFFLQQQAVVLVVISLVIQLLLKTQFCLSPNLENLSILVGRQRGVEKLTEGS